MCRMISILVSKQGKVLAANGIHSHSHIAEHFGVSEDDYLKYEYHLHTRELFQDFLMDKAPFEAKKSHDDAAVAFFKSAAGTPERLIAYVKAGNWNETELFSLLTLIAKQTYRTTCESALEAYRKSCQEAGKVYDKACQKAREVCDKTGQKAGEVYDKTCQEAGVVGKAGGVYVKACREAREVCDKACQEAWENLFSRFENRIPIWK